MVTFSTMPYTEARKRGIIIEEILDELTKDKDPTGNAEDIDLEKAKKLISEKLPLLQYHS